MGRWSWIALGGGAYLAFVLASFPASTALGWFAPAELGLTGVSGTIWAGTIASSVVQGLRIEQVRWRLQPLALLTGRIDVAVEARIPDGFLAARVEVSRARLTLSDVRGATSLPALTAVLPVRGMRGQATVELQSLEIVDGWPTAAVGQVKLADLEVPLFVPTGRGSVIAIGSYAVTLATAAPRELAAQVVDTGGPLEVRGSVKLDAGRNYTLDALIKPRAGAAEELLAGIDIMTAEPDGEGKRRLTLTGSL